MGFVLKTLRTLIWLPLAVLTNVPFWVVVLLIVLFAESRLFMPACFIAVVICGFLTPFELWVRPEFGIPGSRLPKRGKPIRPSRSVVTVSPRGAAPRLARLIRRLPAGLQALLAHAVPEPEAVLHDRRLLQQQTAAE